jgi:hypothetical protein
MADIVAILVVIVALFVVFGGGIKRDKINATCRDKGGVLSYSDHTWGITEGAATVVCADHKAYKVTR